MTPNCSTFNYEDNDPPTKMKMRPNKTSLRVLCLLLLLLLLLYSGQGAKKTKTTELRSQENERNTPKKCQKIYTEEPFSLFFINKLVI